MSPGGLGSVVKGFAPGARAVLLVAGNARAAVNALAPVRVFVWTLGVFFLGLIAAPVVPELPVGVAAPLCWVAICMGAWLGALIGRRGGLAIRREWFFVRRFRARRMARLCIRVGLVGVVLSSIDRFVIRGAPLSFSILETRDAVTDVGSGIVGVVAAATSSFAVFGLVSARLSRALGQPLRRYEEVLAFLSLLGYLTLSVLLGSRSVLLVCILVHLLAAVFFQRLRQGRVEWRTIVIALAALLFLIFASSWLFLERLEQMGLSPVDSIQLSAYAFTLQPSQGLIDALDGSGNFGYVGAAVYSLVLYVFHGFYEFCLLFDNYASPFLFGAQTLWLPIKLVGLASGQSFDIDTDKLIGFRSGVYTTFAGPMFVDFGWLAVVYAFFLFLGLSYPFRRVALGDWRWLPAAFQVAVIIIVAPVVSLLDSSSGLFPLLASFVLPLMGRRRA